MAYTLEQQVGDRSPGSTGFSMEAQRSTEYYFVRASETREAVEDILGTTRRGGDGRLERFLPKCHPRWPWLYASSVEVTSMGQVDHRTNGDEAGLVDAEEELDAPPITSQYYRFAVDLLKVDFTQRPYAVLSDASIPPPEVETYYTPTNTFVNTKVVAKEWLRYTEISYEPSPELAYAQHGSMKFYLGNTAAPHLFTFSGFPRIVVPKATVTVNFYQVPFDYLLSDNSTLVEYVGRINQNDWYGWDAGSLLYLGCKVLRRYTPPFPSVVASDGGLSFDQSKLMDVQLIFEETVREQDNIPSYGAGNTSTTIANLSYVRAGFNLAPFLGGRQEVSTNTFVNVARGFYYAGTANDDKSPVFDSAPFGRLFTDPDV